MKKIDWISHLIELIVVFIGITAAFLLNNWREDRAEHGLALKYYGSMLKDLTADADNFDGLLQFTEHQDSVITNFLSEKDHNETDTSQLAELLQVLVSFSQFRSETGTFETLKYGGNLDLFSDYELREDINSYYGKVNEITLKQKIHFDYINNYCIPYVYKKVDILKGVLLPGITLDKEFTNLTAGYQSLLKQNIAAYQQLFESNMSLKLKLAKKITD